MKLTETHTHNSMKVEAKLVGKRKGISGSFQGGQERLMSGEYYQNALYIHENVIKYI